MNLELLDELLAKAIPPEDRPRDPYDWLVIYSWMIIRLGSDLPTPLDRQIGRGIDPATGRATRRLRYLWHDQLLKPWMSLDDLIGELFVQFTQRSSGRKLNPGSNPGYVVQAFKWLLQETAKHPPLEVSASDLGEGEDDEGDLRDVDDLPPRCVFGDAEHDEAAHPDVAADAERFRLVRSMASAAPEFLAARPDLSQVLRLINDERTWAGIAAELNLTREGLRLRRQKWGLVTPEESGLENTDLGRWMANFFVPDAGNRHLIELALGVLLAAASYMNEQ
jgi:hypothetical protein